MNHWLKKHARPLVLGHRGACAHHPENTLGSLKLAHAQGAHGVEFDVKLCATGEVVLMHDVDVARTTNGTGNVHGLTLAQLRALDAGAGERVPTLDEVFEQLAGLAPSTDAHPAEPLPFLFNIEVTNYQTQGDGLEAAVVGVIRRHKVESQVMFSSFSPATLALLLNLAPELPRGFLYHEKFHAGFHDLDVSSMKLSFRHPHFSMVTAGDVARFKAGGVGVQVWTVNEPDDMRRMAACGVTGIMGDSPKTMRNALNQQ